MAQLSEFWGGELLPLPPLATRLAVAYSETKCHPGLIIQ